MTARTSPGYGFHIPLFLISHCISVLSWVHVLGAAFCSPRRWEDTWWGDHVREPQATASPDTFLNFSFPTEFSFFQVPAMWPSAEGDAQIHPAMSFVLIQAPCVPKVFAHTAIFDICMLLTYHSFLCNTPNVYGSLLKMVSWRSGNPSNSSPGPTVSGEIIVDVEWNSQPLPHPSQKLPLPCMPLLMDH